MSTITLGIRGNLYQARSVLLELACMRTISNINRKARSYWNYGNEARVRKRSHADELSIKRSHCSGNAKDKL
jgi:hypothetical protein